MKNNSPIVVFRLPTFKKLLFGSTKVLFMGIYLQLNIPIFQKYQFSWQYKQQVFGAFVNQFKI